MKTSSFAISRDDIGRPLLDFLSARLHLSRNKAKQLLDLRHVCVNRRRVWMARHVLALGDQVDVLLPSERAEAANALAELFGDEEYLVVNKPAGLLSNGPGSAEARLREDRGEPEVEAVHRLDRDTSGCLLLARSHAAREAAEAWFRNHEVLKVYRAIVVGALKAESLQVTQAIHGRPARSMVRTLDTNPDATYLAVRIETGRTHQIRRHLAALGHPVLGDREYCKRLRADERYLRVERQMLHAYTLEFPHPSTGQRVRAEAPLPADFRNCLRVFHLR